LLQAVQKADVLIEAMGWIRRFRDKITVIKLGGSVMEDGRSWSTAAGRPLTGPWMPRAWSPRKSRAAAIPTT
jgi:hypothetical protein